MAEGDDTLARPGVQRRAALHVAEIPLDGGTRNGEKSEHHAGDLGAMVRDMCVVVVVEISLCTDICHYRLSCRTQLASKMA